MDFIKNHKINQKIYNKVIVACQHLLSTSEHARKTRNYINSRISKDQQLYWKVGYFPTNDNIKELIDLVPKKYLEYLELFYSKNSNGHFSNHNLILPFVNEYNETIALLGRSILPEDKRQELLLNKYKYSNGCKKELFVFGLDKAKDEIINKDFVICVEGQFDCISLHNKGIVNSVALGWANISRYQLFKLHRYTNNIIFMLDNDEAGQKAKNKIKNKYKDYANIKVVSPPKPYKDIDEFFTKENNIKYVNSVIDTIRNMFS